jgi:uncharacterized protein YcgL (UPF0745 family)
MPSTRNYYGMGAWELWENKHPPDLSAQKLSLASLANEPAFDAHSFRDLQRKVAFLNVMNKTSHLLYRGQRRDFPFVPTLLRSRWTAPGTGSPISIDDQREWYWRELQQVSEQVTIQLEGQLPRWRPFKQWTSEPWLRIAPWSVIQHYELWPTPLLDFTSSLRVAASFALWPDSEASRENRRTDGYLYVNAFDTITGDLMEDLDGNSDSAVVRLSAVCPPFAERPHLQEGFLVGNPNFSSSDLKAGERFGPAARLIAKFHLIDVEADAASSGFWDEDFPRHTNESLLPTKGDPLGEALERSFQYRITGRVDVSVSPNGLAAP